MTRPTPAPAPLPGPGRLLVAQIRYQARLLAGGRAVTIGVGLPVILLVASHSRHSGNDVASVAEYAVFGLTLTAWNTYGVRLVAAREAGVLKRWRATPLPRWCYFVGRIAASVVVGAAAGAATIAASVILYGTPMSVGAAVGAVIALLLGGFAWAALATALSSVIPTLEAAAPTLMLTYFPVIVVSGVFGSISEPHWLSSLARWLPAQPLVTAVTASLRHTSGGMVLSGRDLLVLAGWSVIGLIGAIALFRWDPHRPVARRTARPNRPAAPVAPLAG